MIEDELFCVVSFETSHQAIAAEMAVTGLQDARLIPLPPEISKGCGLALRIKFDDKDAAETLLKTSNAAYQHIYELSIHDSKRDIRKLV
ncbi:MAG: DUF3343 domain-containing protein [Treponema sp.]